MVEFFEGVRDALREVNNLPYCVGEVGQFFLEKGLPHALLHLDLLVHHHWVHVLLAGHYVGASLHLQVRLLGHSLIIPSSSVASLAYSASFPVLADSLVTTDAKCSLEAGGSGLAPGPDPSSSLAKARLVPSAKALASYPEGELSSASGS